MNIKVIAAALALALAAPAAQAGCDGITDKKELKACEKKVKAQAKADANTKPVNPSALDAAFKGWDGDANPFATDDYRVRVGSIGIASVDEYLGKATSIQGRVVFAQYLIDQVAAGNADAITALPKMVELLTALPTDAQALITEGQALPEKLKAEIEPADAMKLPKAVAGIGNAVKSLTGAVADAPAVLGSLGKLAANPSAAAGAAAGAGADAAGAAVEDATK